jgi:O-antigen/teichoic acid export membrane protein
MGLSLKKGVSYTLVAQLVSMAMLFAVSVLLTRALGTRDYGLYSIFYNGVMMMSTIGDLGINSAITKFFAENDAEGDAKGNYQILRTAVFAHAAIAIGMLLGSLAFAHIIISIWFDGNGLLLFFFVASTILLIYSSDMMGALYGWRELKPVAIRNGAQYLLYLPITTVFVLIFGWGVLGAASAFTITLAILLAWLFFYIRGAFRDSRLQQSNQLVFCKLLTFALPFSVATVLQTIVTYAPIILTKAFGVTSYTNQLVGYISIAVLLSSILQALLITVIKSSYGYTAHWFARGDIKRIERYVLGMDLMIVALFVLAGLASTALLPLFLLAAYGEQYMGVNQYFFLALFAALVRTVAVLYNSILLSLGRPVSTLIANGVEFGLYLGTVLVLYFGMSVTDWGTALLWVAGFAGVAKIAILLVKTHRELRTNARVLSTQG